MLSLTSTPLRLGILKIYHNYRAAYNFLQLSSLLPLLFLIYSSSTRLVRDVLGYPICNKKGNYFNDESQDNWSRVSRFPSTFGPSSVVYFVLHPSQASIVFNREKIKILVKKIKRTTHCSDRLIEYTFDQLRRGAHCVCQDCSMAIEGRVYRFA